MAVVRRNQGPRRRGLWFLLAGLCIGFAFHWSCHVVLQYYVSSSASTSHQSRQPATSFTIFDDPQAIENAKEVSRRRANYTTACEQSQAAPVEDLLSEWFLLEKDYRDASVITSTDPSPMTPQCPLVFLDFGANIGDSLGKWIDAGLPECERRARIDLETLQLGFVEQKAKRTRLIPWLADLLKTVSKQLGGHDNQLFPESYCYFGVEGNPLFTERLKRLENRIMTATPRPLRHVQFLTETVGAPQDGSTQLYLDTVNQRHNYWGSSTLSTHRDVVKSGMQAAPVQGVTLTTLLRETTRPTVGGHVLIKMDIEGAEYALLNEAYDSGILCDYVQKRLVRMDLLVEVHKAVSTIYDDESIETLLVPT